MNIDNFIRVERIEDPVLLSEYRRRDKTILAKIYNLITFDNFCWNFNSVDHARRRPFPKEFLHNECSQYPCFVFQSPLPKSFNKIPTIVCEIKVNKFVPKIDKNGQKVEFLEMTEPLVTSTNEFIKNIRRKILDKWGTKIEAQPDK